MQQQCASINETMVRTWSAMYLQLDRGYRWQKYLESQVDQHVLFQNVFRNEKMKKCMYVKSEPPVREAAYDEHAIHSTHRQPEMCLQEAHKCV